MATKKQISSKAGKATIKPVVKNVAKDVKPVPKKSVQAKKVAPVKKAAPKKVVSKPVSKSTIKPVAKNVVAHAASKKVVKSLPQKAVKSVSKKIAAKPIISKVAKPAPKPAKPVAKVAPKKAIEAKKIAKKAPVPPKPVAKIVPKKAIEVKKVAKPIERKATAKPVVVKNVSIKAVNPANKIMAKKDEVKSPAAIAPTKKAVTEVPAAEVKAKDIKVPAPKPVVIPKISTKTVRKYQPEFTKSVLDKAQRDPGAPSQRYSDVELQEFRELIQRKLEAAKKELSYLHGLITRKDEMGGDEGDNRYMTMEDGSLSMEREQLSQMASRQITFIDHLEKAVMRIENKTYGICRVTGKLIDKARLRAVPHATLSIEAKMSGK